MAEAAPGLQWAQIYYVYGALPKHWNGRSCVKVPPCSGWSFGFIMSGEKRSTIFCPYTLEAWTVPNNCIEIEGADIEAEFRREYVVGLMRRKWDEFQGYGFQRDYDTAALIFKRLGEEVPTQKMRDGEDDERLKGGKETGTTLTKPVKLSSKRGKFLVWFLEGGGSMSVREAMAEFDMTRSNALSYLYMIQKDHGIGYELRGDVATVTLPDGCDNPFDEDWSDGTDDGLAVKVAMMEPPEDDEDDESWLD